MVTSVHMCVPTVCDLGTRACAHVCYYVCLCNVCSCVPVRVCLHTCVMCLHVNVPVYDTHMMYVFGQLDTGNHL